MRAPFVLGGATTDTGALVASLIDTTTITAMRRAGVARRRSSAGSVRRTRGVLVALAAATTLLSPSLAGASPSTPIGPITITLYASPLGGPTPCGPTDPCSLHQAQLQAGAMAAMGMFGPVHVLLEDGTYDLSHPWTFGPSDSGSNGYTITYEAAPGAHPVLSGAYPITGWQPVASSGGIWSAPVAAGFDTEQLYVDGQRMNRSIGLPSAFYLQTSTGFISSSPVLAGWRDVTNVSAVFNQGNGAWTQTSCPIASVKGDVITMAQPCWNNLHLPGDGSQEVSWIYGPQGGFGGLSGAAQPSDFTDAYELLTPGHWSIDTVTHTLYYDPLPGQSMTTAHVVAPVLGSLLNVDGTLADPVHNLAFAGLTFTGTTWTQPDTANGFAEMQADWTLTGPDANNTQGTCAYSSPPGTCPYASWTRTPAAVQLSATHDVTLAFDTFRQLGSAGLDVMYGSRNDTVVGNEFSDIAANAIQLGSTNDALPSYVGADADEVDANDTIADNYIHDVANQWLGGVGIWVGFTQHAVIVHNQIDDVPYTAISVGWAGWHSNVLSPDSDPNVNSDNVIADNLLYDYMQTLGDGGAIYTNGGQAPDYAHELLLSGNVAYGGTNTDFSLYTDTGSKYVEEFHNVVYDQPLDSFSAGGCHTVGHLHLDGNYFSQIGPLFPCLPATDVVTQGTTLVCTTLEPNQAPDTLLAAAGLEPGFESLLQHEPPSVSLIGPTSIGLGGRDVLISGSGFVPGLSVHFGRAAATSVRVLSGNYLVAIAPPGQGTVAVTVTTPAGTSAPNKASALTYSATPSPCLPLLGGGVSTALAGSL